MAKRNSALGSAAAILLFLQVGVVVLFCGLLGAIWAYVKTSGQWDVGIWLYVMVVCLARLPAMAMPFVWTGSAAVGLAMVLRREAVPLAMVLLGVTAVFAGLGTWWVGLSV